MPYDPDDGVTQGPDGQLMLIGGIGGNAPGKERTWQNLMLDPIGN